MVGRVVSNKMQKSAVVLLEFSVKHPLYQKAFKRSKKYLVDDHIGVSIGDIVEFIKVKPISKNKHWRISKVLGQDFAEIAGVQLKEQAEKQIEEVMPEEKENKQSLPSGGGEQVIVDSEQTEEIKEKPKRAEQSSRLRTKKEKK